MSHITLTLPDELASQLERLSSERHESCEAVAQDMLRRMIALEAFDRLGKSLRASARPNGPTSEEDAFEQIS